MGGINFQPGPSNPCRYRPQPRESMGAKVAIDFARTVVGVAAGTLIALAIARQVVVSEMKDAGKRIEREMRAESRR